MRNLKFNLVRAENILCFGPEGINIDLSEFDSVNQILGINLDAPEVNGCPASNGAGKSSIPELISIGLYGRTIKHPTKNKGQEIVNVLADKGEVEIQWDDFRVIRSFKKSKSGTVTSKIEIWQSAGRIWNDDTKISFVSGQSKDFIEEKIGLSHHVFCNVIIFGDSNTYSFLEADAATKRQIVENLLDLDQYRDYHNNCKDIAKDIKKQITNLGIEYSRHQDELDACDRRILNISQQESVWKNNKQVQIKGIIDKIKEKKNKLQSTDIGAQLNEWQKSQDKIVFLTEEVMNLESSKSKLDDAKKVGLDKVDLLKKERQEINNAILIEDVAVKSVEVDLNKALKLIRDLEGLKEGTKCPVCHGIVNGDNYNDVIAHGKAISEKCHAAIEDKMLKINESRISFGKKSASISLIEEKLKELDAKSNTLNSSLTSKKNEIKKLSDLSKPEASTLEKHLEIEIVELKKDLLSKKEEYEGQSPYKEIMEQANVEKLQKQKEVDEKAKELQELEVELPYYDFWSEAFGDNGIRKFVIDNIIPALNKRISYWLQILIDGLIELSFDNMLDETITRNGNPASYHNMSNGEVRRINLAVSQSFAHVMMLNSGCCPSLIFLDEITGGAIDDAGIPYVYKMIFELAKERQVFITTHNRFLTELLNGCKTITLRKDKDITVMD